MLPSDLGVTLDLQNSFEMSKKNRWKKVIIIHVGRVYNYTVWGWSYIHYNDKTCVKIRRTRPIRLLSEFNVLYYELRRSDYAHTRGVRQEQERRKSPKDGIAAVATNDIFSIYIKIKNKSCFFCFIFIYIIENIARNILRSEFNLKTFH